MNKQQQSLLDAHVAHELEQWTGSLAQNIDAETEAFFEWASSTPLNKLTTAKRVKTAAKSLVVDMPLPESIAELVGSIAARLVALPVNRETKLDDIVSETLLEDSVDQILALSELRDAIIAGSIESPLFTMLVSDILYNGIRDYMAAGTEKLGAVSGILAKGAGAIGKQIDGKLEKRLRGYISANAKNIARQSKTFLQTSLNEDRLRELVDEVWDVVADANLSVADVLQEDELHGMAAYGQRFWLELRQTAYFQTLLNEGIQAYFDSYGKRPITEALADVGVDAALIKAEAAALLPPLTKALVDTGYLESVLRRRLGGFYESSAAEKLLG